MGFRAFLVIAIEVTRQAMAGNGRKLQKMAENGFPRENGRKWISALFTSWSSRWPGRQWQKMVENGRKWQKRVYRDYLVGNGFSRILRHSPTTSENYSYNFFYSSFVIRGIEMILNI